MDISTAEETFPRQALILGFLLRLLLWRIEMGLRARLDAMEGQSTAQQWKRQRFLLAKSALSSLCSGDGTAAVQSSDGFRAVLEDDYRGKKELLNGYILPSRLQRSARSSKIRPNHARFLAERASEFDPLGVVQVGSHLGLNHRDGGNFRLFGLDDGSSYLKNSSRLHPNLSKYSAAARLVDDHGPRHANSSKDFSAAAALVDMRSAALEKSCPKDFSAAAALVDMHVAIPQHRQASEAANVRLGSRERNSHVNMVASVPDRMTMMTKKHSTAAALDMSVSKAAHSVAVGEPGPFLISHGGTISICENGAHQRASEAQESQCQAVSMGLTFSKGLSAPIAVGEVSKTEPVYKQLLERRRADDNHFKELNSEIQVREALWQNLQRTRDALFKLRRRESVQKPTPAAFAPLSEEEELEVQRALYGTNRQEVLVQHQPSNLDLSRAALQCLKPGAWLNDEVINLYMELLKEREHREQNMYRKCHFFNTFFFNKLYKDASSYDFKAVRRWTTLKKLGYSLVECDKIFVPIHKDIHWCLAVINLREKKLQYLDSLKGQDLSALQALARYIKDEAKDKGAEAVDTSNWKLDCPQDIPQQMNGCDCGMFMIKYADFLSRDDDLKFSQDNMEYFRKRTVLELLQLKAR